MTLNPQRVNSRQSRLQRRNQGKGFRENWSGPAAWWWTCAIRTQQTDVGLSHRHWAHDDSRPWTDFRWASLNPPPGLPRHTWAFAFMSPSLAFGLGDSSQGLPPLRLPSLWEISGLWAAPASFSDRETEGLHPLLAIPSDGEVVPALPGDKFSLTLTGLKVFVSLLSVSFPWTTA